ncbi:MAG: aminotransferase class I/II-fold pyridoxal phosphate-dependent enzyme [Calditrichaeota bacterium]|nr:aminotransferase class I/II-fold pyridoxal phosphate-dependent enzyme [Calditrichota bacterium]
MSRFLPARRLALPNYPFAELERQASALRRAGKSVCDLSIGDPDLPPPEFIVDAVRQSLNNPRSHRYPSSRGDHEVRASIARWFKGRFGVDIDPERQVAVTIGGKEALAQIARAVVNPGDRVAFPDPGYPVYSRAGCQFVDGAPVKIPLSVQNAFLPLLSDIPSARLLYLNYPNNPTGATANKDFLSNLALLIDDNPEMVAAYDMAYSEMTFRTPALSLLQFTDRCIEFHSLSKMANATGYRVGFAVGDIDLIDALARVKEEIDSGAPLPFQMALKTALDRYEGAAPPPEFTALKEIYFRRKNALTKALADAGYDVFDAAATFYIWFKVGEDEMPFISAALNKGLLLTPGRGFGSGGKGWARASITAPDEVIEQSMEIIRTL